MLQTRHKVYSWTSVRPQARSAENPSGRTREIMLARSWNEVRIFSGITTARVSLGSISRDQAEYEIASQDPGAVYWRPLHPHSSLFVKVAQ